MISCSLLQGYYFPSPPEGEDRVSGEVHFHILFVPDKSRKKQFAQQADIQFF
jgi:hypothetical protein